MSNPAAPAAPPNVTHSYGANGGAHVCCQPTALDSRAMTHRLSMPPKTVQSIPVALLVFIRSSTSAGYRYLCLEILQYYWLTQPSFVFTMAVSFCTSVVYLKYHSKFCFSVTSPDSSVFVTTS